MNSVLISYHYTALSKITEMYKENTLQLRFSLFL